MISLLKWLRSTHTLRRDVYLINGKGGGERPFIIERVPGAFCSHFTKSPPGGYCVVSAYLFLCAFPHVLKKQQEPQVAAKASETTELLPSGMTRSPCFWDSRGGTGTSQSGKKNFWFGHVTLSVCLKMGISDVPINICQKKKKEWG